jgi:hypothetical protein
VSGLESLPASFGATRAALHAVAEHVLAAARHAATGRIGLVPAGRGFATPPYPAPGGARTLEVDGDRLVRRDGDTSDAVELTTLRAAASLAGIEPGGPADVYHLTTACDPDAPLAIDAAASVALGTWFAFAAGALAVLVGEADPERDAPSAVQLWPEHFDLATDLGPDGARANYGASPGDAAIDEPYLYVGPWVAVDDDAFWDAAGFTGAALRHSELVRSADPVERALAFFRRGRALLAHP